MTTKEIFHANQILTIDIAKSLIGKNIAVTNPEYKHNTPSVRIFTLLGVNTEWEMETPERQDYLKSINRDEFSKNRITLNYEGQRPFCTCEMNNPWLPEGTFFGSDSDREIYYLLLD